MEVRKRQGAKRASLPRFHLVFIKVLIFPQDPRPGAVQEPGM